MLLAITGWGCTSETDRVIALEPGVPILVDPAEPGPVHRAVKDLQRDLELNMAGAALAVDLLDRVERLRARLRALESRR